MGSEPNLFRQTKPIELDWTAPFFNYEEKKRFKKDRFASEYNKAERFSLLVRFRNGKRLDHTPSKNSTEAVRTRRQVINSYTIIFIFPFNCIR